MVRFGSLAAGLFALAFTAGFLVVIAPGGVKVWTPELRAADAPKLTATIPVALIRRRNAFQSGAAKALTAALTDWPHPPGT